MEEKKLMSKKFNQELLNKNNLEQYLEKLFQHIFSNIFPDILNLPRIDFINSLTSSVKAILELHYTKEIYSNENYFSAFLSVNKKYEKKYNEYNQVLSTAWDNYQNKLYNMKKEEEINKFKLTEFKKHCKQTQEYAIHNCNKRERGKYIIVYDNNNKNEKKFIICEKCRKSFYTSLFINYCQTCDCNYYCGLISPKENQKLFPVTYFTPHCEPIANDKINCIKCKSTFYYNMNDNILQCLNPSCKFKTKPSSCNWKCNICSNYFKSDIKLFNNFELFYIKKIVSMALLVKEKAHPGILPCCKNLDENNLLFYHKKDCKGSLYFWLLNQKVIVICDKCKAINFFNRFIWTCPNCGLHFKAKKEEIEEKIKKSLFKNLKFNINMNILLGDEFLLKQNDSNNNSNPNKFGYKMVRKKSFREMLNMKKQELFKVESKENVMENNEPKEIIKIIKRHNNIKDKNNGNGEDNIYRTNSKNKLEEEVKTSMKKRKNYLFEKLLRNQFLSKKSSSKKIYKRKKSGIHYITDEKNTKEEISSSHKELLESEKKIIRLRDRSQSNYFKYRNENFKLNKVSNGREEKYIKVNKIYENDDNKLNNSDDAEKVNETSFIMEYNKKIKKKNDNSNKKGLPPFPLRAKSGHIIKNDFIDENINGDDINIDEEKEYNDKEKYIENNDKNKNALGLEYKLEQQSGYKTPRIILKNSLDMQNSNNKDNIDNNDYERSPLNFESSNSNKINSKSNVNILSTEKKKSEIIVQKLEDKFNENYTQKKTKNKTDSNEDEEKGEKIEIKERNDEVEEEEDVNKNVEITNKKDRNIKQNYVFSPKEKKINNNENRKIKVIFKNKRFQEKEEELETININEEKGKEKEKEKPKKVNNNNRPDDIINASMFDSKIDIPIDNSTINNDEMLYSSIQRQIKKILSKGKLPQFNIDNYQTEKQIGEGSFGFIYQVMNKKTKMKYAMKKIIANNLTSLETYQKEFEIVNQSSHPNILDILGICIRCLDQTTYVLYVLMDLALYDWDFEIEERKKTKRYYSEKELISILKQISSALVFLQKEKNIAHRDVKPENILVFKNGIYKLGDFGEAKIDKIMKKNQKNTIRGTEMYMSPLLFKSLQEDKDDVLHDIFKSDVFSLGYCFIFAAALDFKVISEIRNINSDFKLRKILQRIFFLKYSNKFIELLLKMICNKEEDRVDFIGLEKLLKEEQF